MSKQPDTFILQHRTKPLETPIKKRVEIAGSPGFALHHIWDYEGTELIKLWSVSHVETGFSPCSNGGCGFKTMADAIADATAQAEKISTKRGKPFAECLADAVKGAKKALKRKGRV